MSKTSTKKSKSTSADNGLRAEYDFTKMKGGVRGKYYQAYRAGHSVKILQADGTTSVQTFKLADGAMIIEPDVREYFPDEEAVNSTLRSLIALLPKKHRTKQKA
jgi:hypothetical protein